MNRPDPKAAAAALSIARPAGFLAPEYWTQMTDPDRAEAVLRNAGREVAEAADAVARLAGLGQRSETNNAIHFLSRALHDLAARLSMASAVLVAAEDAEAEEAEREERKQRRAARTAASVAA